MKTISISKILMTAIFFQASVVYAQIKVEEITTNISHISVGESKTSVKALLVQDGNNAVLVDAMFGDFATELKDYLRIKGLTLKHIINTHYHGDHTGGNINFKDTNIISHENTYQSIVDSAKYGPPPSFQIQDMPNILFNDKMSIYLNDIKIDIAYYGPAHIKGDAIVYFPSQNVICVGDIILDAQQTLPFASDPEGTIKVLQTVLENTDDKTKIVTGHGSIGSKQDVINLLSIMRKTIDYVKSGKDLSEYPVEWNTWDSQFLTMKNWMIMLGQIYN